MTRDIPQRIDAVDRLRNPGSLGVELAEELRAAFLRTGRVLATFART